MTEPPRKLSEEEVEQLRDLLHRQQRLDWLWGSLRTWALWVTAIVAAIILVKDGFVKLIRAAAGMP